MKTAANILFTSFALSLPAWAQEIVDPGFGCGTEESMFVSFTPRSAGTIAASVVLGDGQKPPLHVMTKEPVGTKGEWESKSAWFLATAPTMRLNTRHLILEARNSNVGSETTLFDDFKIRASRAAP